MLEPKSRAAHTVTNKTPVVVEDAIVREAQAARRRRVGRRSATIAFHLHELPGPAVVRRRSGGSSRPVASSLMILPRHPRRARRSFTAERANDCWQLDDTGWQLADGTEVKILNVVDDHSRLAVASRRSGLHRSSRFAVLAAAAAVLGWPARFLSDNATSFRHVLAEPCAPRGRGRTLPPLPPPDLRQGRTVPPDPQALARRPAPGRHDRRTTSPARLVPPPLQPSPPTPRLDRRFPADVWAKAPKSGPATQPIGTPTSVYDGTVTVGQITIGHRYRISVGARHTGQRALTVITGTTCNVFIDGHHVRRLTLDPTRRTQPLQPRPTVRDDPRHA